MKLPGVHAASTKRACGAQTRRSSRGQRLIGAVHHTEDGQHNVERLVGHWQRGDISQQPLNFHARINRCVTGSSEKAWLEVDTDNGRPTSCRQQGSGSRPAGDVQDPIRRPDPGLIYCPPSHASQPLCHLRVDTGTPTSSAAVRGPYR